MTLLLPSIAAMLHVGSKDSLHNLPDDVRRAVGEYVPYRDRDALCRVARGWSRIVGLS